MPAIQISSFETLYKDVRSFADKGMMTNADRVRWRMLVLFIDYAMEHWPNDPVVQLMKRIR